MLNKEECSIIGLTAGMILVIIDGWFSNPQWVISTGDSIFVGIISVLVTVGLQIYTEKRSKNIQTSTLE